MARVGVVPFLVPAGKLGLVVARRLVRGVQESQRGVVAVGLQQPRGLIVQHRQHLAFVVEGVPHAALGLEVEAEFVGGGKCGLRRAPGVEAHAVQTPGLADADDVLPGRDIHGGIAGQRKSAAIVRGAEVEQLAVQQDVLALGLDLAQAKRQVAAIVRRRPTQLQRQVLQHGGELAPRHRVRQFHVDCPIAARRVPRCRRGGRSYCQRARAGIARGVADADLDVRRFALDIGEDLRVVDPHRAGRRQFDPADDAVPCAALGVRDAVTVEAVGRLLHAVVDANGQPVLARREDTQVAIVRRHQRAVGTHLLVVDVDRRHPARALQRQAHPFVAPCRGDVDVALIPRDAEVMLHRLRQVRHFDGTRLGVRGILRQLVPPHVARQRRDKLRVGHNVVAISLRLQDSRQRYRRGRVQVAGEPGLFHAGVIAVEREAPLPGKRLDARARSHRRCWHAIEQAG